MNDSQAQRWQDIPASSRQVALELIRFGPHSRSEHASRVGLSPASLSRVTAPLLDAGLIHELDSVSLPGLGRPIIPLAICDDAILVIGISITATEVTGILTGPQPEVLAAEVRPLKSHRVSATLDEIDALVSTLKETARKLYPETDIAAVGVCFGGHVTEAGWVTHAPFLNWKEVPLHDLLKERLGYPTTIDNDLIAFAEAELWFGVGQQVDRFFVMTVGAGTGYALSINGEVVRDESVGYGTITGRLLEDWPDFSKPEQIEDVGAAARRLGRLVGTAAAFSLPESVVISGEGAYIFEGQEDYLTAGVAEVRHPLASGLDIHLRDHDFAFWARGAATTALNHVVNPDNESQQLMV